MRLAVGSTRMELLKLKRRIAIARRGHRLLKDKQDELVRRFLPLIEQVVNLRKEVEEKIEQAQKSFFLARALMPEENLGEALNSSQMKTKINLLYTQLLNLRVPKVSVEFTGSPHTYGMVYTSAELDLALMRYHEVLPLMLELAALEKTVELLALEIEKTRRRVNALEYTLIPNLLETIKYITAKLTETERDNLTRLMKIKEIVRAH
ncbi:MAG TPA: V-type ATP synthase subunit D [Elusimicrobia bacterium]|jgi:V/A-type H+-transporting ATPase subunit D|nr:V-type ATP synthase subunit D [Elusimicrobiota bacterium]